MVKDLFKRSGLYSISLIIGKLTTVFILIYLARQLQPGIFGDLILYTTLAQLVIFFSDFGLNQWYMKQADQQDKRQLFNQVFFTRLTTLLPAIIFSIVFLIGTKSFSFVLSVIFILLLVPGALLSIIDGYYLERKEPVKVAAKEIIRNIFFIYFFFRKSLGLEEIFVVYFVANLFNLVILFPWSAINLKKGVSNFHPFQTLKKSFPYGLLMLASYFYARGDHLVIKYRLNSVALGLYGAAYRYLEAVSLIPTALTHNLFPLSAKKSGIQPSSLIKIMFLTTVFGLIAMIGLLLLSKVLIISLIGQSYQLAIAPLRVFSLVVLLFFINAPISTIVQSSNQLKKFLPFGIANTIFNLILNFVFVPVYGITAAAWVMLTTEITGLFINIYFVKSLYSKKTNEKID